MRTLEEIKDDIDRKTELGCKEIYHSLILEIMCNIAITLGKIAKEIKNEE